MTAREGPSSLLTVLELLLLGSVLVFLTEALPPFGALPVDKDKLLESGANYDLAGNLYKQVVFLAGYASIAALLFWRFPLRTVLFGTDPWLWLFLALAMLSSAWSHEPSLTFRRSVALSGTVIVGFYLGLRFTPREMLKLLFLVCTVVLWASAATVLLRPEFGIDPDLRWRGVFSVKNSLGNFSAFATTVVIATYRAARPRSLPGKAVFAGNLALCATFLTFAGSATAIALLLLAGLTYALVRAARAAPRLRMIMLLSSVLVVTSGATAVLNNLPFFTELLGRDPTLTGRTIIWEFCLEMIGRSPVLGYGYGVFWEGWEAPGAAYWMSSGRYDVHAHNGVLQLLLDLGFIGFLLVFSSLLRTFRRAGACLSLPGRRFPLWAYVLLAMYLALTISENYFVQANVIYLTLYVAVATQFHVFATKPARQRPWYTVALPRPGGGAPFAAPPPALGPPHRLTPWIR